MPQAPVTISCPAKLNLALSVGAADPAQGGRHPLASWMVALNYADRLELSPQPRGPSTYDLAFESEPLSDSAASSAPLGVVDWPLEKDLAVRAHRLLESEVGRELPLALRLRKRIPAGAGLGGGSSDAAGTLAGVNDLYALGLSDERLAQLAFTLGSDVVFALHAIRRRPAAMVTGVGERIEPLQRRGVIHLVLILPPFGCPTGPVYAAFDRLHAGRSPQVDESRVRALTAMETLPQAAPFNDLAPAAQAVQPLLAQAIDRLQRALGLPIHVTGSGAAMFLIAPSETTARPLARKVTATTQLRAVATRTL